MAAQLAEYDASWADRFASEARAIAAALGENVVAVEHVGSTSVPGLAAKPTVDIAVGVTTLDLSRTALERLAALGYEDAAEASRPGERRFRKGASFPRDVIVHVVVWSGAAWRDYLAFRDALRGSRRLASEYTALKRRLLVETGNWYSGADKEEFIRTVLADGGGSAELESHFPEETEAIAGRLAQELRPGDVVTVAGELGAGKTTFVRGACRALGVEEPITSPTFTIGHRYGGRFDVSHLDLYRFTAVSPAEWGDLEPYFEDAVVFVEWPEAAGDELRDARVRVRLAHAGATRRIVSVAADDELLERLDRTGGAA